MHTSNVLEVHLTAERAVHRRRGKKDTFSAFDIKMIAFLWMRLENRSDISDLDFFFKCAKVSVAYVERLLAEFLEYFF